MKEKIEQLHPILNEITQTVTQLYERKKDEETREHLIKLEQLLHEQLELIRDAREKDDH